MLNSNINETILLVEDDETISLGIKAFLEKYYKLECVNTIVQAKKLLSSNSSNSSNCSNCSNCSNSYNLVLLDWNLPDGSGSELFSYIKKIRNIPIIYLTVRDDDNDIVQGLDMGADDYIVKPFKLSVLLSRIKAVLRRSNNFNKKELNVLSCGKVQLFKDSTRVLSGGKEVLLTAGEYRLLLLLLENKNHTLTREVILDRLWDAAGEFVNDNTLTVTIKRLREKLDNTAFIKTLRGIGYRVEDEDEE